MRSPAVIAVLLGVLFAGAWIHSRATSPADSAVTPALLLYTAAPHYDGSAWLRGGERFPQGAQVSIFDGHASHPLVINFAATADAAASFDGTTVLFAGKQKISDSWQVWEIAANRGTPKQITSCAEGCVTPFYLPGSRIVYAKRLHGRYVIETASTNGGDTQQLTFAPGNALPTDVLRDGRILFEASYPLGSDSASAEIYTVYSDGSGVESYRCDHGKSRCSARQTSSGDIVFASEQSLSRFTSPLAHEISLMAPAGMIAGDVVENAPGQFVYPWRPDAKAFYTLQRWTPPSTSQETLLAETGFDLVQPVLLTPRPVPNRHPSALHDWTGANLLCLNAYTSKLPIAAGSIRSVRIYAPGNDGKKKLLGVSPVESDGSFFLHVPADQPLQLELLGENSKPVQREHGWFWLRRGEQRICVGCHAGPERAPENAVPQVLVRSTEPVDMTGAANLGKKGAR